VRGSLGLSWRRGVSNMCKYRECVLIDISKFFKICNTLPNPLPFCLDISSGWYLCLLVVKPLVPKFPFI
jgi:hypothetical protein